MILSCYMPNALDKKNVVALDYVTKHALEENDWREKDFMSRENYGVKA